MLSKSITFKMLLRIAGALCLLWVIYRAVSVATMPVIDGSSGQTYYLIQNDLLFALLIMAYQGLHWFLAAAIVLLCLSFERVRVVYLGLQVSLWVVGLSLWYGTNNTFNPWPQDSMWLLITIACSLVLLALYKPFVFLLGKLMRPRVAVQRPQVKDERFEEYEVQVQRQVNQDD